MILREQFSEPPMKVDIVERRGRLRLTVLGNPFKSPRLILVFLMVGLAAIWSDGQAPTAAHRIARTWSIAFLGTLFYKPMHPVYHDYLDHPLWIVWSINLAVLVALVDELALDRAGHAVVSHRCDRGAGHGRYSLVLQRGAEHRRGAIARARHGACSRTSRLCAAADLAKCRLLPLRNYRALLRYLRRTTKPHTRVANVLKGFPAINGPAGRLSPFPVESGLVFVWLMGRTVEEQFATALEQTPDSVVVWIPDEDGPLAIPLERLTPVIRKLYQPAARFGAIEVWQRKNASNAEFNVRPRQPPAVKLPQINKSGSSIPTSVSWNRRRWLCRAAYLRGHGSGR